VDLVRLIRWCDQRDVPTVIGVHGNLSQYREIKRKQMIDAINAASHPWVTNCDMLDDARVRLDHRFIERTHLPFIPSQVDTWDAWDEASWSERKGLLITGRICTPKGQHVLAALADRLDVPVTFAGQAQFKSARNLLDRVLEDGGTITGPEPPGWSSTWTARTKNGNVVRFTGNYDHPSRIPWDAATVHVNLTSRRQSVGHLEYTTLEAIDAGLRACVPLHAAGRYRSISPLTTDGFHTARDLADAPERHLDLLVRQLNEVADVGPVSRDAVEADLHQHDPVIYATSLLPT
jgi:hypothetical protein